VSEARLLKDAEVAALMRRSVSWLQRNRTYLETKGFPARRPVVRLYSAAEVGRWLDAQTNPSAESRPDPLVELARSGKWARSA